MINKDDVAHATPHHPRHEVAAPLVTDSLTTDCGGSRRGPLDHLSVSTSQQRIVKVDSTSTPCLVYPNANKRREDNLVVDSTAGAQAAHIIDIQGHTTPSTSDLHLHNPWRCVACLSTTHARLTTIHSAFLNTRPLTASAAVYRRLPVKLWPDQASPVARPRVEKQVSAPSTRSPGFIRLSVSLSRGGRIKQHEPRPLLIKCIKGRLGPLAPSDQAP